MVYNFGGSWAQQVADASSNPDYMNCTISLIDDSITDSVYNVTSGVWSTNTLNPVLVSGVRARIVGVRAQTNASGTATDNPTGIKNLRVQFPYESYPSYIRKGIRVLVTNGGRNSALENAAIFVDSDNFSSQRASHTIECVTAVDVTL